MYAYSTNLIPEVPALSFFQIKNTESVISCYRNPSLETLPVFKEVYGVNVETSSPAAGICAERNAIFNMITNGEYEIDRVLCIPPNEGKGAPCGACRELMVQLMPGRYKDIEIMLDYANDRVVKLGELTPEWWIS